MHQRRQSDTFVTMTVDGHRSRLEGENVIQCYKLTDSQGSGFWEVLECRKLHLGKKGFKTTLGLAKNYKMQKGTFKP